MATLDESIVNLEANALAFNQILEGDVDDVFYTALGRAHQSLAGFYHKVETYAQNYFNETVETLGSITGTVTLDISGSRYFSGTLTGETTIQLEGNLLTPSIVNILVYLKQDATGGRVVHFPFVDAWETGIFLDIPTTAYTHYVFQFTSFDQGVTYLGSCTWYSDVDN